MGFLRINSGAVSRGGAAPFIIFEYRSLIRMKSVFGKVIRSESLED